MSDARQQSPDDERLLPQPGSGEPIDEYMEVDEGDDIHVEALPEGQDAPDLGEPAESAPPQADFYANLAELIPRAVVDRICTDLKQKVDEDEKARKKRDEQYEEGVRRTGLGNDAPGGAGFEGASKVVHPMLTEAVVDYEARVIKELWRPSGPVRQKIIGEVTQQKVDRAKRVTDYMNWQLTTQIKEAFSVTETTLMQVPLGGAGYIKQWWDHRLKRPRWDFVPVDRVYIPYAATSFHSATRRTVSELMTAVEFRQRVEGGMYLDVDLGSAPQSPDKTKTEEATDKIEGKEDPSANLDEVRDIWTTMTYLEVSEEMSECLGHEQAGELYPYLISMEASTGKCVAFYRDWEKEDDTREPIEHTFEIPFIRWRGAMALGFPHIIGGLSAAATGALRALLDSAHINNVAGGLILKGSGTGGQNRRRNPGEYLEIERPMETDDIRKVVMPDSFNQPSQVLFTLLGFLVEAGKGVVRTSLDETPAVDGNSAVPVGTQLSRVEEGMVVFSAIHFRVHQAFNQILCGLHRLNRLYLPEMVKAEIDGREVVVYKRDFKGTPDIQPVSDPTIYSDQQRMTQVGALQARATANPTLYKAREVEEWFLELLKIPDPKRFLVDAPQPHELNAVNENLAMVMGRPVVAFPDQNHLAHLQVLVDFIKSPVLGMNPLLAPVYLPNALTHARQHFAMFYVEAIVKAVKSAGMEIKDLSSNDTEVKQALDKLFAQSSQVALPEVEKALGGLMQPLQAAQQLLQQLMPKPPVDPAQAAIQAATAETGRKTQADQLGHAHDMASLNAETGLKQQSNAIAAEGLQVKREVADAANQTKLQTTSLDNATAEDIAAQRIESGRQPGFVNGESMKGE